MNNAGVRSQASSKLVAGGHYIVNGIDTGVSTEYRSVPQKPAKTHQLKETIL
ncbi:MAG: hypothetical protein AAF268_07875 [Cyanobacteria bacterium P01_A01_bin.3]